MPRNKFTLHFATQQDAIQQIIKLLDLSRASTSMHTFEHFCRALGVWQSMLRLDPMGPWLEACRGLDYSMQPLVAALAILMEEASWNYYDIIGGVYMELGGTDKRFAQYFSPWSVAEVNVRVTLGNFKPPAPGEPPLTFYDPCVGSGVKILAAAEFIEERFPGTIGRGQARFFGQDIDGCCVEMCLLNLRLHGIGQLIQRVEDLTMPQRRVLERLLRRRLPQTGALFDSSARRGGDGLSNQTHAAPSEARPAFEDQALSLQSSQDAPVASFHDGAQIGTTSPPNQELILLPDAVAQDLWATAGVDARMEPDSARKSPGGSRRQRSSRRSKEEETEYTPVQLFSSD